MAIRPVDLQLAYMAAPANAAVVSSAQEGPQAAQAAAQAAFAAEMARRQEEVDNVDEVEGQKVRTRDEGEAGGEWTPSGRRRNRRSQPESAQHQNAPPPDGEHFIDVTV